ncbi:hypothetical protein QJS04_geneDACA021215 [Acorus gramineus]|uniref:Neprosin PEP catalytic domain-containing protein n=1 Tax=Acorus gramineus TaxID=55184 RepID=A0AAV9AHF0_ACOGR|nr:hypothetical protein QJS04_geneDACA021215 [Acorus gramineus]
MKVATLCLVLFLVSFKAGTQAEENIFRPLPVKTIKTKVGDIFECIKIHEQPAFSNPLLKHHKIQMKPTSIPKDPKNETLPKRPIGLVELEGGCPVGSVPIQKLRTHPILRTEGNYNGTTNAVSHQIAAYGTTAERDYGGGTAGLNIWHLQLSGHQISSIQIWAISGETHTALRGMEFVEAGYQVNPGMHGDSHTRLFGKWTADNFHHTGCYNTLCPGFVQVSSQLALGDACAQVSEYNGVQRIAVLTILQDESTGNWWFSFLDEQLGYWPKELFRMLRTGAQRIAYGGRARSNPNEHGPPMGSGRFPVEGPRKACFISHLKMIDTSSNYVYPDQRNELERIETDERCYRVSPLLYGAGEDGFNFRIGGPGGRHC